MKTVGIALMIASATSAVAACATIDAKPAASTPAAGCDAEAVQDLIGKPLEASRADAMRRAGAATVRAYVSGSPVTMDYRHDRLNIETDEAGTIVKLSCG